MNLEKKPKVTVLLCTYNCEQFILRSLKSILWQDCQDFEVLILDDASSDNTKSILAEIKDPRIKKIYFKQNRGQVHNLNFGTRIANGAYISFLDVGDIWFPDFLSKMIGATSDGTQFAYCWTAGQTRKPYLSVNNSYADFLYQGILADTITLFISKEATKKIKFQPYSDGGYLKDDLFTLSAAKEYDVKLVPEELSVKLETSYDNGVNLSRNFSRSAWLAHEYYSDIKDDIWKHCGYIGLSRHNYLLCLKLLQGFQVTLFIKHFFLAISYYLLQFRTYKVYRRSISIYFIIKSLTQNILIGINYKLNQ